MAKGQRTCVIACTGSHSMTLRPVYCSTLGRVFWFCHTIHNLLTFPLSLSTMNTGSAQWFADKKNIIAALGTHFNLSTHLRHLPAKSTTKNKGNRPCMIPARAAPFPWRVALCYSWFHTKKALEHARVRCFTSNENEIKKSEKCHYCVYPSVIDM